MSERIERTCKILLEKRKAGNKNLVDILKRFDSLKEWTCTIENMFRNGAPLNDYSELVVKLKHNDRGVIIYYSLTALTIKRLVAWEKKMLINDLPKEMLSREDIKIMFFSLDRKGFYTLAWDYFSNFKWSRCVSYSITELVNEFKSKKYEMLD